MKISQLHLLVIILACCLLALSNANDWRYPDLESDSDVAFPEWGGICDTGRHQSPINLNENGALIGQFDPLLFTNYDEKQDSLQIVNNGHTVQISGFSNEMILTGSMLTSNYVVEQIHLHWWSEHTINGFRYPLEIHIVHRNKLYRNMTAATEHSDGLAVVGILFHVSVEENPVINKIIDGLVDIKSYKNLNKASPLDNSLVFTDLLPNTSKFFYYSGSLTTPSCAEVVTWIVPTQTLPVTLAQVAQFKQIETSDGNQLHNNYRLVQKEHNRAVVLVETKSTRSSSTTINHSLGWIFILTIITTKFLA